MKQLNLLEWNHLDFGSETSDDDKTITSDDAKRLFAFTEMLPINKQTTGGVLTLTHNKLKARGVVGVVQSKSCTLEILPKVESVSGNELPDTKIRKRLVEMISEIYNLKVDLGSLTRLEKQSTTLLEILISVFVQKLTDAIRQGLPQKYIQQEEDLRILRGSLNVTRQFTIHAVNSSILACRFDQFTKDIPLNQIIKAAVDLLEHLSRNIQNQRRLRELSIIFANVSLVPVNNLRWDLVSINRSNIRWKEIYSMAQLFLRRRFQTTTSGQSEGFALLFEMNKLFEEYIGRQIQKEISKIQSDSSHEFEVSLQKGNEYCLLDLEDRDHKFRTQPDIMIKSEGKVIHIIDTKWKLIVQDGLDTWKGVSQADVYQMMAYGDLYDSPRITLLYPFDHEMNEETGLQKVGLLGQYRNKKLEIYTIDVSSKNEEQIDLKKLLQPNVKLR